MTNLRRPGSQQRRLLYSLLGDAACPGCPHLGPPAGTSEQDGYLIENGQSLLIRNSHSTRPYPAWFVKPVGASGRIPAFIYNHAHGGDYQLGRMSWPPGPQGAEYATLRPDAHISRLAALCNRCLGASATPWAHGVGDLQGNA